MVKKKYIYICMPDTTYWPTVNEVYNKLLGFSLFCFPNSFFCSIDPYNQNFCHPISCTQKAFFNIFVTYCIQLPINICAIRWARPAQPHRISVQFCMQQIAIKSEPNELHFHMFFNSIISFRRNLFTVFSLLMKT